ncbi:MAG: prepilin-type N-terminal cleavage/methylation domain-containing protein [Candidatus Gracilibacteria bacterium]|nr:prepilin-type N-terminal cleavage/methylation domain-containing protein [Candidatus Gracilibacteria bacterium]
MHKNHRGNSIIEIMVVIIILTVGIIGTYGILSSGQKLSITSENRIKAINIAREGLEAVENIRDTNWIKFSSDYENCWKVKDYDPTCIGITGKAFPGGSYTLVQNNTLWYLSGTIAPSATYTTYRGQFPVYLDNKGLSTSSGSAALPLCGSTKNTDCQSIFTREIQISNPDADHLKVNSIVTWVDSSKTSGPYIINLETTLTNWKKKF